MAQKPSPDDTKTTWEDPSRPSQRSGPGRLLAITLLLHRKPDRVGERALVPFVPGASIELSRGAPLFAHPGHAPRFALEEQHVSRSPILLVVTPEGGLRLDASGSSTRVTWRGEPVVKAAWSPSDLSRGVVLVLAKRVVVLAHTVTGTGAQDAARGELLGLAGESDGMRSVLADVARVADLKTPVLLRGESGSGKEGIASAIHRAGPRKNAPFVAVNLGAIPPSLAASELFGSERGAFTGATRRVGYFEQAAGGTLFLDEVGEAPVELQAALLRALQDGEIQPVGSDRPRKVDVRVLGATDADLESRVSSGAFRAPLLNRLAAYQVWIPALRDRRDDIARLFLRFLREELRDTGETQRLSDDVIGWLPAELVAALCEHDWPGNVRQLRNVTRHLVIGSRGRDALEMTPAVQRLMGQDASARGAERPSHHDGASSSPRSPTPLAPTPPPTPAPQPKRQSARKPSDLSEAEILEALRARRWEIAAAATELGVTRPSLYRRLETFAWYRSTDAVSADEIRGAHADLMGDLDRMTERLRVSEAWLVRRLEKLGLTPAPRPEGEAGKSAKRRSVVG